MHFLIREIRELFRGPELVAVLLIWALLGAGESARGWVIEGGAWIEDRMSRVLTVCPCPELFEELQRLLPPLR